MRPPAWLRSPPRWALTASFVLPLLLSAVDLAMFFYARTIPGTEAFQRGCLQLAALCWMSALAAWLVGRWSGPR